MSNDTNIRTPRTDAAKEYLKQETAKNDDGDMSLFSVSGVMGVMAECVFLERELAQAKAELYRCQSDRQREHDLRVKFAGEIESLKERYENLMAGVEIGAEARLTETAQHGRHLMELNSKLSASRKDSERLDWLIDKTGDENSDGSWSVGLNWDNEQDVPQVVKDGKAIGEYLGTDDEEAQWNCSGLGAPEDRPWFHYLFRAAIDAAMEGGER